ncbi:MAG: hypothetical protein LBO69_09665 [Ignavibacteria bacterium]|jgi:hypothetical protein|nr:hypothetical protein [Ignavibacteria bacterium]
MQELELEEVVAVEDTDEHRLPQTKEELIEDIREAFRELKRWERGEIKFKSWEEFKNELHS